MFKMNGPAVVSESVIVIPLLAFADARMDEMETCAIVFSGQYKGYRSGTRLHGFPGIAEAMGWVEDEDIAKVVHSPRTIPLKADRTPGRKSSSAFTRNQRSNSACSVSTRKTRCGVALMKSSFSIERPSVMVFSMITVQSFLYRSRLVLNSLWISSPILRQGLFFGERFSLS